MAVQPSSYQQTPEVTEIVKVHYLIHSKPQVIADWLARKLVFPTSYKSLETSVFVINVNNESFLMTLVFTKKKIVNALEKTSQ